MHKKTSKITEPIVIFILVIITIMEFLIYGGGIASGNVLEALNSMIGLMLFGAALIITTILIRIYELINYYINGLKEKGIGTYSSNSKKKSTKKRSKKRKK